MDRLEKNSIVKEVQDSFLEYSMSVIVARALPDLRDGLNQFIEEFYIQCMNLVILQINLIKRVQELLGTLWGNIIPMEIRQFMKQW